jgi:hypothetical protein
MDSIDSNLTKESTFFITTEIRSYLLEASRWGKFLAIMGYIGIGLILMIAIGIMAIGSDSQLIPGVGVGMGAFGMIYIILAVLYFFPVYYLHQFSAKTKEGINSQDTQTMATGFQNLKSLFKFMGIVTIVILSIYALVFFIAIAVGTSGLF